MILRADNPSTERGPIEEHISKLLAYGDQQMFETQIKIAEIRQALNDFERQKKEGKQLRKELYPNESGIKEVPNYLRLRRKSISPLKETCDFDAS